MKPESEFAIGKRADTHQKHATESVLSIALPPFRRVLDRLIPPHYGYRAKTIALLEHRASWDTIRCWRRGYRKAPQWAWDIVATEAAKLTNAIQHGPVAVSGYARAL